MPRSRRDFALVSGHRDKADRIAANPAVDAVYVALPNSSTPSTPSAPLAPASTSSARSPWTSPPPSAAARSPAAE